MNTAINTTRASALPGHLPRGMRVVIVEADAEVRGYLSRVFAQDLAFWVAGVAQKMSDAEPMIAEFVPEIVVCPADETGSHHLEFPETLWLHPSVRNTTVLLRPMAEDREFPMNNAQVGKSLSAIKGDVLCRKGEWLRSLLSSASGTSTGESNTSSEKHLTSVSQQIDEVIWARSTGNYVLYHGSKATWKERGSLSRLRFNGQLLRISRSCAVNRRQVESIERRDGSFVICMKCGTVLRPSRSYVRIVLQALPQLVTADPQ